MSVFGASMASPAVVCAGILVVDIFPPVLPALPKAGELVLVDDMQLLLGGCAANSAVGLARLGVPVAVSARVGADPFGEVAIRMLSEAGAETRMIRISPTEGTSKTVMLPVAGEDRRFIHTFGANASYSLGDLDLEQVRQARVLFVSGWFGMPAFTAGQLVDLFRAARAAGVVTVLDVVVPGGSHGPGLFASLKPALPYVDYFLPNTDEAAALSGEADPLRQAMAFRAAGARTVVITLGAEGSLTLTPDRIIKAGVYPVEYVDGTGSGDAFAAGLIAGLLEGRAPEESIALASAVAAAAVQAVGATTGLMDRVETLAFIKSRTLPMQVRPVGGE